MLRLLAVRLTNKEIAHALGISVGTVKQHTRSVFSKLHADNRRDAIVQARNMGFQFDSAHLSDTDWNWVATYHKGAKLT